MWNWTMRAALFALLTLPGFPGVALGAGGARLSGTVFDRTGGALPGARVALLTASDGEVSATATDQAGHYAFDSLEPATYVLAVGKAGFAEHRRRVTVAAGTLLRLDVALDVATRGETVTVTAERANARELSRVPQTTSVTSRGELARRPFSILPQALAEEPGVHVQQTSTSQGSPFIRGLTGQQVVTLIDGVRFNNATFRPGANQYTALVDASFVERVEIVRGPSGPQYGSDSLGGTINLVTTTSGAPLHPSRSSGGVTVTLASADRSAGGSAFLAGGPVRARWLVEASGRRTGDLRPGQGRDSHSVATRLLGLPSSVLGDRLQDTAYGQYGTRAKLALRPASTDLLTIQYLRGAQAGASRYDQLNGGLGNLLNRFDPQTLDFLTARYERLDVPLFDTLSATLSYNRQRDDRLYQSINNAAGARSPRFQERNVTGVKGVQAQATRDARGHAIVVGGERYDEVVDSRKQEFRYNASTQAHSDIVSVRARFPNGARYQTVGLFAQDTFPLSSDRVSASLAIRYSRFRYSQSADRNPYAAAGPVVPTYQTSFSNATFNSGLVVSLTRHLTLTASASRGFRAPNVNDYGSIGLSGLGFEISPDEAARVGASVASSVSGQQPSTRGHVATRLEPETLLNVEIGARWQAGGVSAAIAGFDSEVRHLIERRALILPSGALGSRIGGQTIVRQDAAGTVYTALSSSPVFVRANAGRVRLRGAEASLNARMGAGLALTAHLSSVRGEDLDTGLPPGIENGIPPTHGFVGVRWTSPGGRLWLEGYSRFARAQGRLSGNDLEQARIGGIRTRQEITSFFNNGALARGLVADGVLLATGETLPQVLDRVLCGQLDARLPLFRENPSWITLNARFGVKLSDHSSLTAILENGLDANYRTMGSGIDAPGINLVVRHALLF